MMKYLMNLSTHPEDVGKLGQAPEGLLCFLADHGLDGIEVINYSHWQEAILPKSCIVGYHMPFWPLWLPFWQENQLWTKRTFGDLKTAGQYYGGESKDALVKAFKSQLMTALDMQAEYAVFHVSHCELEECFSYEFKTSSEAVVSAFIELLNHALAEVKLPERFMLLFENQWWPGLDFLEQSLMARLLHEVKHDNLGFLLDTGHFMNSHLQLRNEAEALIALEQWYEGLGTLKTYVKAVHLSSSLSGHYVMTQKQLFKEGLLSHHPALQTERPFFERYFDSFHHIGEIDQHRVFEAPEIKGFIEKLKPQWLVLEFMTGSKQEADQKIGRQLDILKP